jgi:5-enolpyruvylshikimate-3-phosphate synthase
VRGRRLHAGGLAFDGHGDHRIFMSLVLFALACDRPCVFADGESTEDSFPGFGMALGIDDVPLQGAA